MVLHELKRRGYRLGILSHIIWTGPACRRYFQRHGLSHLIDAYSFSSEVGRSLQTLPGAANRKIVPV